jgi:hypothetical protein
MSHANVNKPTMVLLQKHGAWKMCSRTSMMLGKETLLVWLCEQKFHAAVGKENPQATKDVTWTLQWPAPHQPPAG